MARFDVYRNPNEAGYLLDVQADLLSQLSTTVVVPLYPMEVAPTPAVRLNPSFDIEDRRVSMVTQFMAAVPRGELRHRVGSLDREATVILDAIGFLHHGW
jgi:toxin CcdB